MVDMVLCRVQLDRMKESALESHNHCGSGHVGNSSGNQPRQP